MQKTRKIVVAIGVAAVIVGALAGGVAGFELGTRVTHRVLRPLVTAGAGQAHLVLTLLDRKEEGRLRQLMEREIDSGILMLDTMAAEGRLGPGDPQSLLRDELREYRRSHPSRTSAAP